MEQFEFAIQVMVIGFLVVLVTLFALYGILLLFAKVLYREEKAVVSNILKAETKAAEIPAVIMAAVYAYMESSNIRGRITGVSINAKTFEGSAGSSWQVSGRKASMENRNALEKIRRKRRSENI